MPLRQGGGARAETAVVFHLVTVKDTRAGDKPTPGPERPDWNGIVAASQAGMYPYFLSIFIQRGALRSTLIAS
jgi:hypothetical protein